MHGLPVLTPYVALPAIDVQAFPKAVLATGKTQAIKNPVLGRVSSILGNGGQLFPNQRIGVVTIFPYANERFCQSIFYNLGPFRVRNALVIARDHRIHDDSGLNLGASAFNIFSAILRHGLSCEKGESRSGSETDCSHKSP